MNGGLKLLECPIEGPYICGSLVFAKSINLLRSLCCLHVNYVCHLELLEYPIEGPYMWQSRIC